MGAFDALRRSPPASEQTCPVPGTGSWLGSERAQVFERAAEQVLAEVEEAGPERRSGPGPSASARRRSSPSRARTSTASSRYACATRTGEACTPARSSTGCPLDELCARPGSPYQERPSALVGLELEQVARRADVSRPVSAVSTRSAARRSAASRAARRSSGCASPRPSARAGGRTRARRPRTRGAARRVAAPVALSAALSTISLGPAERLWAT